MRVCACPQARVLQPFNTSGHNSSPLETRKARKREKEILQTSVGDGRALLVLEGVLVEDGHGGIAKDLLAGQTVLLHVDVINVCVAAKNREKKKRGKDKREGKKRDQGKGRNE